MPLCDRCLSIPFQKEEPGKTCDLCGEDMPPDFKGIWDREKSFWENVRSIFMR